MWFAFVADYHRRTGAIRADPPTRRQRGRHGRGGPMLHGLTGWHLLIVLAVIVLLFGAAKLPALAQSVGKSARLFKGELKAMKDDDAAPLSEPVEPGRSGARADTARSADSTRRTAS